MIQVRAVRKTVASILVVAVAGNAALLEASQATVWADRRPAPRLAAARAVPQTALERAISALPSQFGSVRKITRPSTPSRGVIVAISDIHANPEAQRNIGRAIESLASAGWSRVGLEGASGPIDLAPLRRTVDRADLRLIADFLASRDDISGAIEASLVSSHDIRVTGIDDAALHARNADAFLRSRGVRAEAGARLARQRERIDAAKTRLFSPALSSFDAAAGDFHSGKATLGDYLRRLVAHGGAVPENAGRFLRALEIESRLDFEAVDRQRRDLLQRLSRHATREQLADLLDRSAGFRAGRVTAAAYHDFLRGLCAGAGVRLDRFPALEAYVRYVSIVDAVDASALLADVDALERSAYAALATTPAQRSLVEESRWARLGAKLLEFSLTREEWRRYLATARPAGAPAAALLEPFETFYRAAHDRDAALAANAAAAFGAGGGVTVAGGFHAEGMRARLAGLGWTVVEFSPRVTRAEGGSGYLSVFAREKTPLERLFAGEKVFLKSDPLPPRVRNGTIPGAALALRSLRHVRGGDTAFFRSAAPAAPVDTATARVRSADIAEVKLTRDRRSAFLTLVRGGGKIRSIDESPESLWERSVARPLVELPGLPGFPLAGMALAGNVAGPVLGGLAFAALHGIPGRGQSVSQFAVRSAAAVSIGLAAAGAYGHHGLASAIAVSFVLHALWNALAPERFRLAVNGWRKRLGNLLERIQIGFEAEEAVTGLKKMLRDQFDSERDDRVRAWRMISRGLVTFNERFRPEVGEILVRDILERVERRALRQGGMDILLGLLRSPPDDITGQAAWNLTIENIRREPKIVRHVLVPRLVELALERTLDPDQRNAALSDLEDLIALPLEKKPREEVRATLIAALSNGPEARRQTIPHFLISYARTYPGADGELLQIEGALVKVASGVDRSEAMRELALEAVLSLTRVSDFLASRKDAIAGHLLAILDSDPGDEISDVIMVILSSMAGDIRDAGLRRRAAIEIVNLIDAMSGANVHENIAALAPLYRRFSDKFNRRALLRAVIDRLEPWESAFARRPEVLGEIGVMLAGWLTQYDTDIMQHEAQYLADHVVRFYPRVGRLYRGLVEFLVAKRVLTRIEADDRLPWAHWDLDPGFLEREPIVGETAQGRAIAVLGRFRSISPSLTVVQQPEYRLLFGQTGDYTNEAYAPTLPENFDMIGSTVYQDGYAVMHYPARLVSDENEFDLMLLLGQPINTGRMSENLAAAAETIVDETPTRQRGVIRVWTSWKVGNRHFRRPGVSVSDVTRWTGQPDDSEPLVVPLGHSHDLRTAFYLFPETGVIYALELNQDARLQAVRQAAAARDARSSQNPIEGTLELENEQLTLKKRGRIVEELGYELADMEEFAREPLVFDVDDDAVPALADAIEKQNAGLYDFIFGTTDAREMTAEAFMSRVEDFLWSRHVIQPGMTARLSKAFQEVFGGHYVPSLNTVVTDEGRLWIVSRVVDLATDDEFQPLHPDIEKAIDELEGRRIGAELVEKNGTAADRIFVWLREPLNVSSVEIDLLERLMMPPMAQLEATIATFVRMTFRAGNVDFAVDDTNRAEAGFLGEELHLAEPLLEARPADRAGMPTYVEVTVENRLGRTVFAGNAGDDRTVGDVIDSVSPGGVPSRESVESVTIIRTNRADRAADFSTTIESGESVVVRLKQPFLGHLHLVANVGVAGAVSVILAFLIAGTPMDALWNAAVALAALSASVAAHELWHLAAARVAAWVEGRPAESPSLAAPAVGRAALSVRATVSSRALSGAVAAAALSAVPVIALAAFLPLAPDHRLIAVAAIAVLNLSSLIPMRRLFGVETDGDIIADLARRRNLRSRPTVEQRVAAAVADGMAQLSSPSFDRAAFSASLDAVAGDFPGAFELGRLDGSLSAISGASPFMDEDAYAAALARELLSRGLPTDAGSIRAGLQALSANEPSRDIAEALSRTDLFENQGNVAVFPPGLAPADESRLADLLLRRAAMFRHAAIFVASDAAQAGRLKDRAGERAAVVVGTGVLGERAGRGTVEMAVLVGLLASNGIDLATFSGVRFIAPAGRTVVMEGVGEDLPWLRQAALILIDDVLRSAEASMPALNAIERVARLVAEQA